jgi:hypothetical protein
MSESHVLRELQSTNYDSRFQLAHDWIARLRKESFNRETEQKLANHPYLKAAEAGILTMAQKRAFVCEQLAIQKSDAVSFAHLAGHRDFSPSSLSAVKEIPRTPTIALPPKYNSYDDLFQFLLGGEIYAAGLLLDHAKYLGLEGDERAIQEERELSPLAQAYPSYWARLALGNQRAAGAAACAVNFPAWGRMCQCLLNALLKHEGHGRTKEELDKGLAFIQFFGSPIENLDDMAAAVMMHSIDDDDGLGANSSYAEMAEHVRLLQAYELLFWDACYSAK